MPAGATARLRFARAQVLRQLQQLHHRLRQLRREVSPRHHQLRHGERRRAGSTADTEPPCC